jgi:hypothetical protein
MQKQISDFRKHRQKCMHGLSRVARMTSETFKLQILVTLNFAK